MKNKLGYVCKSTISKSSLPKDYWNDGGNQNDKYITLRTTFKFSNYWTQFRYAPYLIYENEVNNLSFFDDLTESYNIFLREKLQIEILKGIMEEELDF